MTNHGEPMSQSSHKFATVMLEPIREDLTRDQRLGAVKRFSMMRIMARRWFSGDERPDRRRHDCRGAQAAQHEWREAGDQGRAYSRGLDAGKTARDEFDAGPWGKKYPSIAQSWRRNWQQVVPFFAFPEAVRRITYTTNAIEALNAQLRRAVRTRGHFPTDDAAMKPYLVLRQVAGEWKMPPREWCEAKTQFVQVDI